MENSSTMLLVLVLNVINELNIHWNEFRFDGRFPWNIICKSSNFFAASFRFRLTQVQLWPCTTPIFARVVVSRQHRQWLHWSLTIEFRTSDSSWARLYTLSLQPPRGREGQPSGDQEKINWRRAIYRHSEPVGRLPLLSPAKSQGRWGLVAWLID